MRNLVSILPLKLAISSLEFVTFLSPLENSEFFLSLTANACNFFKSRGPCLGELKYVENMKEYVENMKKYVKNMKTSLHARRWYILTESACARLILYMRFL